MDRPDSAFEAGVALAMQCDSLLPLGSLGSVESGFSDPGLRATTGLSELLRDISSELTAQDRMARLVRTIEFDVIPRLLRSHASLTTVSRPAVLAAELGLDDTAEFTAMVLAASDGEWMAAMEAQLGSGVCVEDLYMKLLAPVAVELGRLWDDDRISCGDVALGLGRLQRTLRTLSAGFDVEVAEIGDGRRVLLCAAPGNDHRFGLSLVAEFFRRAGWDVTCDLDSDESGLYRRVRSEWFDVVGISVGNSEQLQWLPAGLARLRQVSRNKAVGVMVGGPVFAQVPMAPHAVGADSVVADAREAPGMAERLLGARSERLVAVG